MKDDSVLHNLPSIAKYEFFMGVFLPGVPGALMVNTPFSCYMKQRPAQG